MDNRIKSGLFACAAVTMTLGLLWTNDNGHRDSLPGVNMDQSGTNILETPRIQLSSPLQDLLPEPSSGGETLPVGRFILDSHSIPASSVEEWRYIPGSEGKTIEAIAWLPETGLIHLRTSQRTSDRWEIQSAAFLGEFMVPTGEATESDLHRLADLLDRPVEVMRENRMFTLVSVEVSGLEDAIRINDSIEEQFGDQIIEPNHVVFPSAVPNDPNYSNTWTLNRLELELVWQKFGFSPGSRKPVVAVIDNGAPANKDFSFWVNTDEIAGNGIDDDQNGYIDDRTGYNFSQYNADMSFAGGHGTEVAKIASSLTNNGYGTASPASWASLMRLLYYEEGYGGHFAAIEAMMYAIDNGADVLNCSFVTTSSTSFSKVMDSAKAANVIVVAAAGNGGSDLADTVLFPVALDDANLIGVGASNDKDALGNSNYSITDVDVFAPGSATSYSTPLVTSTVALLKALRPDASSSQIKAAIIKGVDKNTALANLCVSGGRLNASGAVEALLGIDLNNTDSGGTTDTGSGDDGTGGDSSTGVTSPSHYWSFDGQWDSGIQDGGSADGTLTLNGSGFSSTAGIVGNAIQFSGSHNGLLIPDSSTINLSTQSALTVSLWVKPASSAMDQTMLLYEQGGSSRGLNLVLDRGYIRAGGWNKPVSESNWSGTTLSGPRLQAGEWNHVALVLKAGNTVVAGGLKLFVNGTLAATGSASQLWAHGDDIGVGQVKGNTLFKGQTVLKMTPFAGSIDELSYWPAAMTGAEIQDLILSTARLNPLHYWSFDSGWNPTIKDSGFSGSPLGIDGTGFSSSPGIVGNAISFSGTHKGLLIPDSSTINLSTQSAVTVSLWVKPASSAMDQKMLLYEQGGSTRGLNLVLDRGYVRAGGWNKPTSESNWSGTTLSGPRLQAGEWNHVALVLKAGNTVVAGGLKLFVNGTLAATGSASQLWAHGDDIGVGQVKGNTLFNGQKVQQMTPFTGLIDELSYWPAAMTGAEIQEVILSTISSAALAPTHLWGFDTAWNPTITDSGVSNSPLGINGSGFSSTVGIVGNAIQFSGGNTGLHIPDSTTINLSTQSAVTVSLWVKPASSAMDQTMLLYEQGGSTRGVNIVLDKGYVRAGGWNKPASESNWSGTTLNGPRLQAGEWNHVALVLKAGNTVVAGGLKLFVNGTLAATGSASQLWAHGDDIGVGQVKGNTLFQGGKVNWLPPFVGSIDELSYWSNALSGTEILELILNSVP